MFRFDGMKLFVDGTGGDALGNRYDDVKWTQEELNHMLSAADTAGIQATMHVVTDGGSKMETTAIEETRRQNPRRPASIRRLTARANTRIAATA
jgi:predicted amidohydrolase YtcJ